MARTTIGAVKGILRLASKGGDYDDTNEPALTGYIESASAVVSRVNTCASAKGITLSSTELELIERWLSAHAYVMSDQTYAAKATSRASGTFHGETGLNLDATKYGQMAKILDPSGCLVAIASAYRVGAYWLGKPPSTQLNYDERD